MQVDNFYLDMNGIIHTCTHSNNDHLIILNEKEMFKRIFAYTDRLYKLVRPSRLMFLAVDGVAPRAKMNQQRSRRFRSAKEREALIADHVAREGSLPTEATFDSNCITPGTDFMFRLGIAFRRWIAYKMETDPFWRDGAEVVFSGPDVPGEGEHKVMDMIRKERAEDPDYIPGKFKHCMYGLDADLIMLSLVTHEPYFVLLREKIKNRKQNKDAMSYTTEDFELLEISVLRKMLEQHFSPTAKALEARAVSEAEATRKVGSSGANTGHHAFSLERIIDDFVFMCCFVGNDFLPCVPHMDIADGSLNLCLNVYQDMLPHLGGYLTDKAKIHPARVELFFQEIARREYVLPSIFKIIL
jgi:5'-3' exoribonuclease 1